MATVTPEFFDMVEKETEHFRRLVNLPPSDAKCHEDFEKHIITGHTGRSVVRCYSCWGTDRAPIPWAEVMQHG